MASRRKAVESYGGSHDFTYIKPSGRRLSEYEAVTCYTQPSPHGGGLQSCGDYVLTPTHKPLFDPDSTKIKVSDWYAFRDPNQMWQRPYYAEQSRAEQAIESSTEAILANGGLARMDKPWITEGLACYLAFAHFEYGLFKALNIAARESLSDTVNNALAFNAADKLRHAQAIAILGFDIEQVDRGFDGLSGRRAWLAAPEWQRARRLIEQLTGVDDWVEIVVAVNMAAEPIFAEPLRQIALAEAAGRSGDLITPVIAGTASRDWLRNARWTQDFIDLCAENPANRSVLAGWRDDWAQRVAQAIEPVVAVMSEALDMELAGPTAEVRKTELGRVASLLGPDLSDATGQAS